MVELSALEAMINKDMEAIVSEIVSETQKAAGSAPEKQPSQQGTDGSTSKEPQMLTEAEHQRLLTDALNAAKGELGRKHNTALAEAIKRANDAAQSQIAKLEKEYKELESDLDELAKDDEDKSRLAQLIKNKKKAIEDAEARISAYEPKIAKAEDYELTELCNEVARDYEGADAARLKRIAGRTKFSDDEEKIDQIRSLADDIWAKKTTTPAEPQKKEEPRKMDSGVTTGKVGLTAEDVMKMTPDEKNRRYKEIAAIPF